MLPLAATSFNRAIKALGAASAGRRCTRRCTPSRLLALLHFFWMRAGKNDFAEVAVYAAIIWRCCWAGARG
jgi:sulfoxide reductase heme-binding subunit YedZ